MDPTHPRRISISLPPRVMAILGERVRTAKGPRATRSGQIALCIELAAGVELRRTVAVRGHAQRIARAVDQLRQRVADVELTGLLDVIAGEAAALMATP